MIFLESVSKIRRWILVEGRSIRSVARATGLSRNTVSDLMAPRLRPLLTPPNDGKKNRLYLRVALKKGAGQDCYLGFAFPA